MKRSKNLWLALPAMLALFVPWARSADTPDAPREAAGDVRCLLAAANLGKHPDVKVQTSAMMAMFYYFGRLQALAPTPEILEEWLAKEDATFTLDQLKSESVRCGTELTERGKQLQTIGQHLADRENKAKAEAEAKGKAQKE